MAAAACRTCSRNEVPPTPVPSIQDGVMPSACATCTGPGADTGAMPSMSRRARPAWGTAVQRALDVQLQGGVTGQPSQLVGLGRARDDDPGVRTHGATSAAGTGPKTG